MRKYNINATLVGITEQLYNKATSADRMIKNTREWFRTTVGVRPGCLLSPALFNTFFFERIVIDVLKKQDGKASTCSRNITSLRFADDIDALEALVNSLNKKI